MTETNLFASDFCKGHFGTVRFDRFMKNGKNFSFLYDDKTDAWRLSPAYDLTYSTTYFGEHTTSVDGNGSNHSEKEIVNVGVQAGMKKTRVLK